MPPNANSSAAVATAPKRRLTRVERAAQLRERIFQAAGTVVGELGYADTTVARIVAEAGIAQGTFYLYFESRQALFDELLPHFGAQMLSYVADRVSGSSNFLEVEERGFIATIECMRKNYIFYRILNDAEIAAPVAHKKHMDMITERYVKSMQRDVERGLIKPFKKKELEVLAYVFEGARSYLYMRYLKDQPTDTPLPRWVVDTYMTLVSSGMAGQGLNQSTKQATINKAQKTDESST